MRAALILLATLTVVFASSHSGRIYGGSLTTIEEYPQAAVVLTTYDSVVYFQFCGGTILNNVAILTAAHCPGRPWSVLFRVRVGSSFASSGGFVHQVERIINHPNYDTVTTDNNISILRLASPITFSDVVQQAAIAGPNYNVADNQPVYVIGWGHTEFLDKSEQLRHVQVNIVNQERCQQQLYDDIIVSENMLCTHTEQRGQGSCVGDEGAPLLHNNVVVGVESYNYVCSLLEQPALFTRVSRYTEWIVANAQSQTALV